MNGPISIILPMPTIILQFLVGHEQNNGFNFPCVHWGQYKVLQTNDTKEEEFDLDLVMDEYILHKDPNIYPNMFSPISNAKSEDVENNESSVSEDQDENIGIFYKKNTSTIFLKSCSIKKKM